MRDWSEAGIEERSACNKKITDKLAVLFKVGVVCNEGVRQGPNGSSIQGWCSM